MRSKPDTWSSRVITASPPKRLNRVSDACIVGRHNDMRQVFTLQGSHMNPFNHGFAGDQVPAVYREIASKQNARE
jgi:hypothetical protein